MSALPKNHRSDHQTELPVYHFPTRYRGRRGNIRPSVINAIPAILNLSGLVAACICAVLSFFLGDILAILILLFLWPGLARLFFGMTEVSNSE